MYMHTGTYLPCTMLRLAGTSFHGSFHEEPSSGSLGLKQSSWFATGSSVHSVLRASATQRSLDACVRFVPAPGFGSHESDTLRKVPGSATASNLSEISWRSIYSGD